MAADNGQEKVQEDDDFEEDEEDEESVGGALINNFMGNRKPKQSMFATLACSFQPKVNDILSEGEVKAKLMQVANFDTHE